MKKIGRSDIIGQRGMTQIEGVVLAMDYMPIQLMWPTTFDPTYKIPRKLKESSNRRTQDQATVLASLRFWGVKVFRFDPSETLTDPLVGWRMERPLACRISC